MYERKLEFDDSALAGELFGPGNANLERLSASLGVAIDSRGATAFLKSEDKPEADLAGSILVQLYGLLKTGRRIYPQDVDYAVRLVEADPSRDLVKALVEDQFIVSPRKTVAPKTLGQREYLSAMRNHDLVFGVGPAGTGKTYLAVAMAVSMLMARKVKRIVLTRPAVEAGEKLGFLPGDLAEKINPYLRPLYDALHDMLEFKRVQEMLETSVIEIAPLAFMRGRTLNDAFIILDEAQNSTREQMMMFLTRLGFGSKAAVTGDVTQIDLPGQDRSGLVHALGVLKDVEGVAVSRFGKEDVIRHPLVGRIVQAYERHAHQPAA